MTRIVGLTGATLATAPTVCHECVFWQSTSRRGTDKRKWIRGTEEEWGAWGTVYYDDDGRLLGSMQYGPSDLFPRAAELTAIGDARDKGARALEAFAYRYGPGDSPYERFQVHKTIFPRDFLADFGFTTVRATGRVELARLELGGLVPVVEGTRERVLRVVREAFLPAPAPVPPHGA